jgi:hypothetical protein
MKLLDSHGLEAAYVRAKDFLLQLGTALVDDHGWQEEPDGVVSYPTFA